jgi:sialic acid synthase SpsE
MDRVQITAEIGENHCGDMGMARDLIAACAEAGADYAKFQLYDASRTALDDPERDLFFRVQLTPEKLAQLVEYARSHGIRPLCTPWDVAAAEAIFQCGIPEMKIASFHIVDHELLRYVNEHFRTVFMSTGMASLEEIRVGVACLPDVPDLYLLHCVSEYPLPEEHVNLRMLDTLNRMFGQRAKVGYSDHTLGILAPVAAVARGACAIEKHVTLDKSLEGTDHVLSVMPDGLRSMVQQIRSLEKMMGTGEKILTPVEQANQTFLRERFHH